MRPPTWTSTGFGCPLLAIRPELLRVIFAKTFFLSSYAAGDSSAIATSNHVGKHAVLGTACLLANGADTTGVYLNPARRHLPAFQRPNSGAAGWAIRADQPEPTENRN